MLFRDALNLIKPAAPTGAHWADLGCGSGLFTRALATLLADGSTIDAIDAAPQKPIESPNPAVEIRFQQQDFTSEPPQSLDGVLMANSLHFVRNKAALLKRLNARQLIIVEYDTMLANPYVPYPADWAHLEAMLKGIGLTDVRRLGDRPSVYGKVSMYAASAR
ncbi:MAG TPA: class I SAM-dependent methyltransferase [Dinghuibacter sp.]|uniref:class I SAM-dependent methyltransferase n=1 Tax=Dinghuibacter sp. TaxID=2024697 RepID=UPI002C251569|nr:class I SAM-dependent methyltransferase [Dinghuibacter sp.]HTJ11144.1 class I SAM-dependent methyltransferase [Dinghuibacter sp.]